MTTTEFNRTNFAEGYLCIYKCEEYQVVATNEDEKLIGIYYDGDFDDIYWVRCENITAVYELHCS